MSKCIKSVYVSGADTGGKKTYWLCLQLIQSSPVIAVTLVYRTSSIVPDNVCSEAAVGVGSLAARIKAFLCTWQGCVLEWLVVLLEF